MPYPLLEGFAIKQRMEIRTPALHSAFGREFPCLSPPPPPQLLSSYSSSIIWCLLMAGCVFLTSGFSFQPHTVPLAQPNTAHLILSVFTPLSHPSSQPYPITLPLALSLTSHSGSIGFPISDSSPVMIPPPLLPSFLLALCWAFVSNSVIPLLSLFNAVSIQRQLSVRGLSPTLPQDLLQQNF